MNEHRARGNGRPPVHRSIHAEEHLELIYGVKVGMDRVVGWNINEKPVWPQSIIEEVANAPQFAELVSKLSYLNV